MKIDAILFDKDGTLMDFDAFWVPVSIKAIDTVLSQFHRNDIAGEEILAALGVRNAVTNIDGVLCKGSYTQIGQIIYEILIKYECNAALNDVVSLVEAAFNSNINAGEIKPTTTNLSDVLAELKKRNKKLALATTDNSFITKKCLKVLGIENMFDIIYTSDETQPAKPDPYCVFDFCELFEINKERVVMVGDTITDVTFAKNAGITMIGVAKNKHNRCILQNDSYAVISDLSDLLNVLE